jgi:hypothetical protein
MQSFFKWEDISSKELETLLLNSSFARSTCELSFFSRTLSLSAARGTETVGEGS